MDKKAKRIGKRKRQHGLPTPEKKELRSSSKSFKSGAADSNKRTYEPRHADANTNRSETTSKNPIPFLTEMDMLETAMGYLKHRDPVLQGLMDRHGPATSLLTKAGECPFGSLSRSICYQHLATKAAAKIFERVLNTCGGSMNLSPSNVLSVDQEILCEAGLSRSKARYLHNIAHHFASGALLPEQVYTMEFTALSASLLSVKGIGPWTVDMFAMFHLGHADILPVSDLGIKKGMMKAYGLSKLPSPEQMAKIADTWAPYRSVGSYYMWKALDASS